MVSQCGMLAAACLLSCAALVTAAVWAALRWPRRRGSARRQPVVLTGGAPLARVPAQMAPLERAQVAALPRYTRRGVQRRDLPAGLTRRLRAAWRAGRATGRAREAPNPYTACAAAVPGADPRSYLHLVPLPPALLRELEAEVGGMLAEWTGVRRLEHTATYGAREYGPGAVLGVHADRAATHALSAIVHLGETGEAPREPWALHAWPFDAPAGGPPEEVALRPGEVLLYESATVPHGRPTPYRGAGAYANVFVHFRPASGWADHPTVARLAPPPRDRAGPRR
jgi:prolyl 4-hydroxylase